MMQTSSTGRGTRRHTYGGNPEDLAVVTKNSICTGIRTAARIAIELMGLSETGCDLNHKRLTLIEIERPPNTGIFRRRSTGRGAAIGEPESGTNQAARRS